MSTELHGLYRLETNNGREYAFVECGKLGFRVSRRTYEAENYSPAFNLLPWEAELENAAMSAMHTAPIMDAQSQQSLALG